MVRIIPPRGGLVPLSGAATAAVMRPGRMVTLPSNRESASYQGGRLLVIGDSIAALHAQQRTATSVTLNGTTTATVAMTTHLMTVGEELYGMSVTPEGANCRMTVASSIDANSFTVTLSSAQSGTVTGRSVGPMFLRQSILTDKGTFNWFSALADACFDIVGVHAEPGSTTAYLDDLIAQSAGLSYDWVAIISGINDVLADTAAATIAANIIAVADGQIAAGKKVIISKVGPFASSHGSYTAGRYTALQDVNAALVAYAQAHRGSVFILDTITAAGGVGNSPAANLTSDGIHPTAKGAYTYAKQLKADYSIVPTAAMAALLVTSASQDENVDALQRQLWNNPLLSGTGGDAQGDNATFAARTGVPDGHVLYLTGVAPNDGLISMIDAADGYGKAQRMDWSAAASGNQVQFYPSQAKADAVDGEYARLVTKVTVGAIAGGATTALTQLYLWNTLSGSRIANAMLYGTGSSSATFPQLNDTLTLVTPRRLIPSVASYTTIRPQFLTQVSGADSIRLDISRVAYWAM